MNDLVFYTSATRAPPGAPLLRSRRTQCQGVDPPAEQPTQRVVDQAVLLETAEPLEKPRHDRDPEMPAPGRGSGVARVPRALVTEVEVLGIETLAQGALDHIGGIHPTEGTAWPVFRPIG